MGGEERRTGKRGRGRSVGRNKHTTTKNLTNLTITHRNSARKPRREPPRKQEKGEGRKRPHKTKPGKEGHTRR